MSNKSNPILNSPIMGYAHHRIVLDNNGKPEDYEFLEVNATFEKLTGLKAENLIGKTVRQAIQGIEKGEFDWIGYYGEIAINGREKAFEQYSAPLDRWYSVHAYSTEKMFFTTMFIDISEKHRIEEEFKKTHKMLQVIINAVPQHIFWKDRNSVYLGCNQRGAQVAGLSNPSEIVGKTDYDLPWKKEEADFFRECDQRVMQNNAAELHIIAPELQAGGKNAWIDISKLPFYDEDGTVNGVLVAFEDITAQKASDLETLRQAGLIKSLLTSIPDIVFFKDCEGVYLGCNPLFAELVGKKSEEEVVGKTDYDLFGKEMGDFFRHHDNEMLKQLSPRQNEEEVTFPDGRKILIETIKTPYRDKNGVVIGILGISRDVTERKRAEELLAKSEDRYNRAISGTGAGLWDWDIVKNTVYFSPQWKKMLGYEDHEIPNDFSGWRKLWHPDEVTSIEKAVNDYLEGKSKVYEVENRLLCKDGTWHWILTRGDIEKDSTGKPVRWTGTNVDITERKNNETALKESEYLYRNLLATIPDLLIKTDLNGVIVFVKNYPVSGKKYIPDEKFLGKNMLFFIAEQDQLRARENTKRMFEDFLGPQEYQLLLDDGTLMDAEVNGDVLLDAENKPKGMVFVIRDITDRRVNSEVLMNAKEQFELAVDGSNDGIWDWNLVTNALFLSSKWKAQLGYKDDELANEFSTFESRIHDEDKPRMMAYVKDYLEGKVSDYSIELRMQHKDLSWRWILARGKAIRNDAGLPVRMAGSHTDITERKKTEADLANALARASAIMNAVQTGIVLVRKQDRVIVEVNPAACRLAGATKEEIVGKICNECLCPAQKNTCPIIDLNQEIDNSERSMRRADGTLVPVLKTVSLVVLEGVEYLLESFVDISKQKETETVLVQTNQHLEEATALANSLAAQAEMANAAKSEFLANMSHEIRTPMNGVLGMTSLLLDTTLSNDQSRYAANIKSSGESLLGLLNDILDYSKIEAHKLDIEVLDFDLRSLLDDFAAMQALRAQEKGLEFICSASPDVPSFLRGDAGRLRQILVNLAGNAIKFTAKGEVSVLATVENETDGNALIRFSIRDTGIGIPEDKQSLLFSKFTQVDASTTRKFGGTGLGLAISKQLSVMMGGEIGLSSIEGKGSEFWFTVRLEKQDCVPDLQVPQKDVAGQRILVVDDNATNREVLMCQLKAWQVVAEEAADGPTALTLLYKARDAGKPFSCALLDMQMPGMSGTVLAQAIKADKTLKDTCLILLTSIAEKGDAKQMHEIGFSAYLPKPIRQSELLGCLKVVLSNEAGVQAAQPIVTRHTIYEMKRNNARVLLAEDNIINQQVAQGILQKLGVRTDVVANGMEAIKALETIPYDLVLMDCHMPEMDGYEATAMIRSTTSSVLKHDIPIIAMTANAMQGDRDKCLNAGMSDYIPKPVAPDMLAKVLEKWLPGNDGNECLSDNGSNVPVTTDLVFDYAGLKDRLMDDTKLIQRVLGIFIEDIPKQILTLKSSIVEQDNKKAEMTAHSMKGAAGNIGIIRFRNIAAEIEDAGRNDDYQVIERLIPALEKQFDIAVNAIRKKVPEQPETQEEKA